MLGDGCRLRSGAVVKNSILWEGATIGSDATIQNSIIGKNVAIENGCTGGGCVSLRSKSARMNLSPAPTHNRCLQKFVIAERHC